MTDKVKLAKCRVCGKKPDRLTERTLRHYCERGTSSKWDHVSIQVQGDPVSVTRTWNKLNGVKENTQ